MTVNVSATKAKTTYCELDPTITITVFQELPSSCPYTGAGGQITTSGAHTVFAASTNSAGDMEVPVSLSLKIDLTRPKVTCERPPTFALDARPARVKATVSDAISGPVKRHVYARANTSKAGRHQAVLTGTDRAGLAATAHCSYTVVARTRTPTHGSPRHAVDLAGLF